MFISSDTMKLSYNLLKKKKYGEYILEHAPEKVLQFGEGNFLRAFVDYFIDIMNEKVSFNGKVVVVQPIDQGLANVINEQEGLYTLITRGNEKGSIINKKRIISCISRCINPYKEYEGFINCAKNKDLRFIVSNTTEAGIVFDDTCKMEEKPARSFPGKLTQFLYERFKQELPGFIILSCELIDNNGIELKKCVEKYAQLWKLSKEFIEWIEKENTFCSTLVDRIVVGYPFLEVPQIFEELGYEDNIVDICEAFSFWVIEGNKEIEKEFPASKAGLPIMVVENHMPYKQRKVRILNGAHTSMALAAYLSDKNIVKECMEDKVICDYLYKLLNHEIIPTLDLQKDELTEFGMSVLDRFNNPYIDHALLAISLNSTSKWKARVMPSLLKYIEIKQKIPTLLTFSFAALLEFYCKGYLKEEKCLIAKRDDEIFKIYDEEYILDFYLEHKQDNIKELVNKVVNNHNMWGRELSEIPEFEEAIIFYLEQIRTIGMYEALKVIVDEIY